MKQPTKQFSIHWPKMRLPRWNKMHKHQWQQQIWSHLDIIDMSHKRYSCSVAIRQLREGNSSEWCSSSSGWQQPRLNTAASQHIAEARKLKWKLSCKNKTYMGSVKIVKISESYKPHIRTEDQTQRPPHVFPPKINILCFFKHQHFLSTLCRQGMRLRKRVLFVHIN